MAIPEFRPDGYLPTGTHPSSETEAVFRFGSGGRRRRRLAITIRQWCELARQIGAGKLLLDGSFVTSKSEPRDVDAVVLLPPHFHQLLEAGDIAALQLEEMLTTRQPAELFAAEDDGDWREWVEFFSRTREADGRRKGLVEIRL